MASSEVQQFMHNFYCETRMPNKTFLLLYAFFLSGCVNANHKNFLWELTKDSQKVYLLGVAHAGPTEYTQLTKSVKRAYEASDTIVFESIAQAGTVKYENGMNILNEHNLLFLQSQLEILRLDGLINEEESETIRRSHIADLIKAFEPIVTRRARSFEQLHKSKNYVYDLGVDHKLAQLAVKDKKKILALESIYSHEITWQKTCSPAVHYEATILSLMQATYSDTISQESIETIKAVHTGDIAEYFRSYDHLTQKYKHLKYELECSGIPRTIKWAGDWEKVVPQPNTTLVVVGAAHTLHEPSLPTLLAKQGYTVKRVED